MAQKCVHKGCGKVFTDPDEECVYHPGPPEFHEGQKGWKCCKPRVLTFDEFLAIPPCTTGKHSTVDDTPAQPPKPQLSDLPPPPSRDPLPAPIPVKKPLAASLAAAQVPTPGSTPKPEVFEEESDAEDAEIPASASCKRRGCGKSRSDHVARDDEECIYHPGVPLFHEGSKGWTCCKRRVLEFDEFMKIEGCKKRSRHCYVGKKKADGAVADEQVREVRNDFYQTASTVIVSFYLKKIDKARAKVEFSDERTVDLDLPTGDGKRYTQRVPLFAAIEPGRCSFRILGTKLEVTLAKKDGTSWNVLRSDEVDTGERIQIGRAGRV